MSRSIGAIRSLPRFWLTRRPLVALWTFNALHRVKISTEIDSSLETGHLTTPCLSQTTSRAIYSRAQRSEQQNAAHRTAIRRLVCQGYFTKLPHRIAAPRTPSLQLLPPDSIWLNDDSSKTKRWRPTAGYIASRKLCGPRNTSIHTERPFARQPPATLLQTHLWAERW
jgi:hypothetical protein